MFMLFIFVIFVISVGQQIKGTPSLINVRASFKDGEITFKWNVSTYEPSPTFYILYNNSWTKVNDTKHTVKDVYLFSSITIYVTYSGGNDRWKYTVQTVQQRKGNSVQIEWPNLIQASGYTIYHTLRGTRAVIQIENNAIIYEGKNHSSKYTMINVPPLSNCISFEIMNITLKDAGFYSVGTADDDSLFDRAIFLIVTSQPVKPKINGNLSIYVTKYTELICSSESTSAPDYYFKRISLSYTWYINNTKIDGKTGKKLRLCVTRDLKYNRYSCTATEEDEGLESERSDSVQINPLYGPQMPLNLTVYSDENGKVNMTLVSGFTGGLDQFFVISRKNGPEWEYVRNFTDLGEGSVMYFEVGTLTPGQNNCFRLESCNMFNCTAQYVELDANLKGSSTESTFLINKVLYAIIGVWVAVLIIIVILVVVLVKYFRRKHRTDSKNESFEIVGKQQQMKTRNTDDTETDDCCHDRTEKENQNCAAEVYTFVEKNFLSETDEKKNDVTENNQGNLKGMSSEEVPSTMAKEPAEWVSKEMCLENVSLEERKLETENSDPSRKRNDEGLIYIDLDFMRKSDSLDKNPVIHGEENRIEYTFVDFSKKAPPMQETRDDLEMQEES